MVVVMGKIKLTLFLAFKSIIRGNRWALVMIILIMSLSFANLILTPSIISGVTKALNQQQINALYGNIIIDPIKSDYYINNVSAIIGKVEPYPGVTGVAPHLDTSAFFEYNWLSKANPADKGNSGNWPVIGIDPESENKVTSIHSSLIAGSYLEQGDRSEIILGVDIAGGDESQAPSFLTLGGVSIGDTIRLTYPNNVQKSYTVKGIFRSRESQADNSAFVTRTEMVSVLGQDVFSDRANRILIKINQQGSERISSPRHLRSNQELARLR
jgi:putative ABC transport system permease protein